MARQVRRPSEYFRELFRAPQVVVTENAEVNSLKFEEWLCFRLKITYFA